jgi:transcription initiation factor TFIIH subunit 1
MKGVPSAAELEARSQLLKTNVEIAQLYEETVKAGVISDEDFWEARRNLFSDVVARKATGQKHGIENTLDGDLKGARDGMSDTVTCNLTNEKMHRIFAERPSVREAFLNNVPKKMTEREFWTRFLRSEYFKQMRAGAPPQGEEEAADLALFARKPPDATTVKAQIKAIEPGVNLKADLDDGLGEGYGLLRDGSRDDRRPKEAGPLPEVFLELNHHAAVVLRGQPQVNIVDARTAAIAARDHEKSAESARIGFEEPDYSIDDLAAPKPVAPPKELKIRDSHQYFSSIAEEPVVSKPSKTHVVIEPFKEAVASALSTLQHPEKKQKRALDPDIALQVLKEVTQSLAKVEDLSAQFASQQSFSNADDVAAFPENVNEQLRRSAATGGELLRQFWMSTPMITSVRWEKATKVCKSVEILYDKLEGVKSSLPSAHRHIASQRLRPLLGAFDSALTFYDDEKTRRPQAYADFEKTATQENS